MSADDVAPDLLALIQEAALDDGVWRELAVRIGAHFGDARVRVGVVARDWTAPLDAVHADIEDPRLIEPRYLSPEVNPGVAFALATPALTVATRESMVSDRDLPKLEFYNAFMRPAGLWRGAVANLYRDDNFVSALGVLRTRRQGPFTAPELRRLAALGPHLNRTVRVWLRRRELEAFAGAAARLGDLSPTGAALVDGKGRIAAINAAGQRILDDADGLEARDGVLRASLREDAIRLARLIFQAAGGASRSRTLCPSEAMRARRPSLRRPLSIVVSPTRGSSPFARASAVTVSFAYMDQAPEVDRDHLRALYSLTGREAEVVAALVKGLSPAEAAEALAMSVHTLRSHVRHILDRTGARNLTDLVRTVLTGPASRR